MFYEVRLQKVPLRAKNSILGSAFLLIRAFAMINLYSLKGESDILCVLRSGRMGWNLVGIGRRAQARSSLSGTEGRSRERRGGEKRTGFCDGPPPLTTQWPNRIFYRYPQWPVWCRVTWCDISLAMSSIVSLILALRLPGNQRCGAFRCSALSAVNSLTYTVSNIITYYFIIFCSRFKDRWILNGVIT